MQDAHNLAWKLAAVLKGTASQRLLASYQAERKPVAQANTDLSVANWHEAMKVPKVLGLDPRAANFLNAAVASGPVSLLPSGTGFFGQPLVNPTKAIGEPSDPCPSPACARFLLCSAVY